MKTQHSSNGEYIHKITDSPMVTKARLLQTGTSGLLHLQAVWPELTHLQCFLEIVLSKTLKTHGHNPDCLRIIYFNFPTGSQPSPSVFPTASLLKICRYIRPAPDFFSFFKQQPHSPMMDQINYFLKPVPAVTPYAPLLYATTTSIPHAEMNPATEHLFSALRLRWWSAARTSRKAATQGYYQCNFNLSHALPLFTSLPISPVIFPKVHHFFLPSIQSLPLSSRDDNAAISSPWQDVHTSIPTEMHRSEICLIYYVFIWNTLCFNIGRWLYI